MAEAEKVEEPEFKWGKKRGIGGKKKDVQFYESFTYDGVDYTLYDSVYLYCESEPEPYIGKIIKIWENSDKTKKVKVLWYLRPCEIENFLEGSEALKNELFLACGEGLGLANVNPLEAIAGKCNVICTSKDSRNLQPSDEELRLAEFVFYRFFDVGQSKITEEIDDKIAGIEVKNIFNNLNSQTPVAITKLGLDKKGISGTVPTSNGEVALSSQKSKQPKTEKVDDHGENDDSKALTGDKTCVRVNEDLKFGDVVQMMANDKTVQAKFKENGVSKASLVKEELSARLYDSKAAKEKRERAKIDDRRRDDSFDKTLSMSKVNLKRGEFEIDDGPVKHIKKRLVEDNAFGKEKYDGSSKVHNEHKSMQNRRLITKDNDLKTVAPSSLKDKSKLQRARDDVEDIPSKKLKVDGLKTVAPSLSKDKSKLQRARDNCDVEDLPSTKLKVDDLKTVAPSSWKDKSKFQRARDHCDVEDIPSQNLKVNEKATKLSSDKSHYESSTVFPVTEVTRRPDVDTSRWFKSIPWEEKLKTAHDRGTLVLLENLDPSLTSEEVQDIIWQGFKESCTASVIPKDAFSSPHTGQAFAIFKKKEAAELVVKKLKDGCFLMSNGCPLIGSIGRPFFPEKKPVFYGHYVVDPLRMQQREMKDAVSTSHCSQPNNIEYDMAMDWCLLQERGDKSFRRLYQRQGEELRKLKAKLKSKSN